MPLTRQQGLEAFQAGASGNNSYAEGDEARKTDKLKAYLLGQSEKDRQARAIETLQKLKSDPEYAGMVNQGGSVTVNPESGSITAGGNPYAKIAMQGPHQAQAFLKTAQGAYKGINDQLDSSKATIDNLNLGNDTGDRLALLNEAKLALAGSGGRAFGQVIGLLSGDRTIGGDAQKAMNWIQNTPNIPKMQPAQRDAIREGVFNRIGQISQQHQQAKQQLMQQGPVVAPQADTSSLISSFVQPAEQKLSQLQQMQSQYSQERAKMQSQPAVSTPSVANANPSTLDRLKSFLGGGQKGPAQAPSPQGQTMRVKHKASGQTGTIPAQEFDPNVYDPVQ